MEPNHLLSKTVGPVFAFPDRYRRLIGKLIYLALTRPELAYVMHTLAQFMQAPQQHHLDAALCIVCYLKGYSGQGILLPADSPLLLAAYCDYDWTSCPLTRCSITSYFLSLGGSPIS